MKNYTVPRADGDVPLTGDATGPWTDADGAALDEFNWDDSGPGSGASGSRPVTRARALYDDDALYLQYVVEDPNVVSRVTELNGPIHTDSCVEFFATPLPGENANYVNFEANPGGFFKMAWMEPGWEERGVGREYVTEDLAGEIDVRTSPDGPTREPTDADEEWWLAAEIPFATLSELSGLDLAPEPGERWRANFHRTGVDSRSQEASWNPIGTPEKRFHSPGHFGWLVFE